MGIKRVVDVNFWNDDKVVDSFSPEDKLFMLYLMTNPHTTQLGIYAINKKQMAFELGYSLDTINVLLDRFENKYQMIKYIDSTKELAIKNYLKYSIIKGGKPVEDLLEKEIKQIKNKSLLGYVYNNIKDYDNLNDTVKKVLTSFNEYILNDNEKHNDNDNDNEKSSPLSYNDTSNDTLVKEFENLWQLFPNKKGKNNALRDYIKARKKGVKLEIIADGLKKYLMYIKFEKIEPRYIKNGSTWFHQECWDDDYNINRKITTDDFVEYYNFDEFKENRGD